MVLRARMPGASFVDGDFNSDGEVDFDDFLILAANFGRTQDAVPARNTPAPANTDAVDSVLADEDTDGLILDDLAIGV